MKNVTPAAGQVWRCNLNSSLRGPLTECQAKIANSPDDSVWQSFNEFVPQNDLEWLAVNEPEWFHDDCRYIRRNGERAMYCDVLSYYHNNRLTCYTRVELQNMRYELYPDEKPKRTDFEAFAKGLGIAPSINFNCPCTTTPLKKETKMIDLSKSVVGDEFVDGVGCKFKLMVIGKNDAVLSGYNCNGELYHYTSNFDGRFSDDDTILVSKHDPRWWLKDLPDADLFGDSVMSILVSAHNEWNYELINGVCCGLSMLKMPKLTGDEWRDSKISIPDLKTWQEQNK